MLRHGRAPTGLESVDFPTSSSLIKPLMLIWCHERCHKSENEARRDAFQASATLVGAQALLCKKTKQFAQWLESPTGEQRYVLITDWREAQPCMQAIAAAHKLQLADANNTDNNTNNNTDNNTNSRISNNTSITTNSSNNSNNSNNMNKTNDSNSNSSNKTNDSTRIPPLAVLEM
ncbi:unnamed protein product, partial [Polarella glacialis]